MQTSKRERVINRIVDGNLVVSITKGNRVRILRNWVWPISEFKEFGDDIFLPGFLLSPTESAAVIKKLGI